MENRIEDGARDRIESETGTKLRTGLRSKRSTGSKVAGIGIENDTGIEIDICRYNRRKIIYVHADAAAGINYYYTGKSPARKCRTTSSGTWNHNNPVYNKTNIELGVYDSDFYTHIVRPDEMIQSTTASVTHNRFTLLSLEVTTWSTRVSDELRSFPRSIRRCRLLNEPISERYPVYSYNSCLMECRINMILQLCGCVPHFYKPLSHERICPIKNLSCVAKHRKEIASLSVSKQTLAKRPSLKGLPRSYKDCACLNLCEVIKYRKDHETLTTESLVTRLRIGISAFPKVRVTKEIIFGFYDVLYYNRERSRRGRAPRDKLEFCGALGICDVLFL
ncbi:hypothetical protein EVAR_81342_1 [Eumeta japonica]|uniref:Sodium channel protein Nach n=1 Tax=Eumeta variegata TaxID=151549 RepID=A0A4C1XD11_EUMVA|nr:hypothetical protein EVAR_81342_1 [Eumeta japonica]